jgi:hypothetical protein
VRNDSFRAKAFDKARTARERSRSFGSRDGLDFSKPLHIHTQYGFNKYNLPNSLLLDGYGNQIPVHQPITFVLDQKCMEKPVTKFTP